MYELDNSSEVKSKQGIKMAYNFRPQMTNFCLPQPSFVPVKNNLKKDFIVSEVREEAEETQII